LISDTLENEEIKRTCAVCQHPASLKTTKVSKIPDILIVRLNRFKQNNSTQRIEKNKGIISFSATDSIDVASQDDVSEPMNMFALIDHRGELNSGHYTAYCFNVRRKQ
jgi:ubiquitin C-terminal hydrolase